MRNSLILAGLTGILLSGTALAADLPRRAAPPPVFQPVPVFTWTGFYAGFNAGYGFGTQDDRVPTVIGVGPASLLVPPGTTAVVAFSNRGSTPCRVSGAPGAHLVGADGNPLGREAEGEGAEGPFVRVPSGGSAITIVRVVNVRDGGGPLAGRCTPKPAAAIAIDAPNYGRYEQLPVTAWGCAETDVSSLSVGVLRSGAS